MAEYFPWMTKGPDGKPVGLEVEIVERLVADIGVQLQLVTIPFDELAAREVDMVASNLSITPARALKVAFSQPYSISEKGRSCAAIVSPRMPCSTRSTPTR